MATIGIVGLGNMGSGMAVTLAKSGYDVIGYDPYTTFKDKLSDHIKFTDSIAELAQATKTIIISLPNSQNVEDVILSDDGIFAHAQTGTIILETSSADPKSTQAISKKLLENNIYLVDGPVSGGPKAANSGSMTMFLGGLKDKVDELEAVISCLTKKAVYIGESGAGHATKLINNLLCGINLLATGELISITKALGLDAESVINGINAGSGRSGVTEVNAPTWILNNAFDSGFSMKLMRKDLRAAAKLIQETQKDTPLSSQAINLWQASAENIADELDFNQIVNLYK